MINTITESELRALKAKFKLGSRVQLDYTNKPQSIPVGTKGTVQSIDDTGTIHVSWDNGSNIGVTYGIERCHVITDTTTIDSDFNYTD